MPKNAPRSSRLFAFVFFVVLIGCSDDSKITVDAGRDVAPDVSVVPAGPDAPQVDAPQVDAPQVDAPQVDAPQIDAMGDADADTGGASVLLARPGVLGILPGASGVATIVNAGDLAVGPLTFTITGENAADFTYVAAGCESIAPFTYCTVTVQMVYTGFCPRKATLVGTSPGPEFRSVSIPLSSAVTGGLNPGWITPATYDFGAVNVGASSYAKTFTFKNGDSCTPSGGAGPFAVTATTPDFVVAKETCSAAPIAYQGTCTFDVVFKPTTWGGKSAGVQVAAPFARGDSVSVSGTGLVL